MINVLTTNNQINVLTKELKFIPTPVTKKTQIRQQLLCDFDQFARRTRLVYIFRRQNNNPDPCHVKSAWKPPIQRSLALESHLQEVKSDLALKLAVDTKPSERVS